MKSAVSKVRTSNQFFRTREMVVHGFSMKLENVVALASFWHSREYLDKIFRSYFKCDNPGCSSTDLSEASIYICIFIYMHAQKTGYIELTIIC